MYAELTVLTVILLLAGVVCVVVGFRGRVAHRNPHCARCRFDLAGLRLPQTGSDAPVTCPECGARITHDTGVRRVHRAPRRRLLIAGAAILAITLPLGILVQVALSSKGLIASLPTWVLLTELQSPRASRVHEVTTEVTNRVLAGSLSQQELARLASLAARRMLPSQRDLSDALGARVPGAEGELVALPAGAFPPRIAGGPRDHYASMLELASVREHLSDADRMQLRALSATQSVVVRSVASLQTGLPVDIAITGTRFTIPNSLTATQTLDSAVLLDSAGNVVRTFAPRVTGHASHVQPHGMVTVSHLIPLDGLQPGTYTLQSRAQLHLSEAAGEPALTLQAVDTFPVTLVATDEEATRYVDCPISAEWARTGVSLDVRAASPPQGSAAPPELSFSLHVPETHPPGAFLPEGAWIIADVHLRALDAMNEPTGPAYRLGRIRVCPGQAHIIYNPDTPATNLANSPIRIFFTPVPPADAARMMMPTNVIRAAWEQDSVVR